MSRVDRIAFIGDRQSDVHLLVADAGVKAVNLARLDRLGLRVPPALALSTALSHEYLSRGALPPGFAVHLATALRRLEDATGLTLGGRHPLLVSVRSSPVVTMPGMLDTLLNVGLTEDGVQRLVGRTGNAWFAWDCYRRAARGFAELVHHVAPEVGDRVTEDVLAARGAGSLRDLDPLSMRELARASAAAARAAGAPPLPDDPVDQIVRAVDAVLASWNSPRAREYRRIYGIDDRVGTGVLVQAMVFGNAGAASGSGVGFTRNPSTGDDELYVDFLFNAQGEDIVSGRLPVRDGEQLRRSLPRIWGDLQKARPVLEREFADMQDFEFTVDDGRLFFLQTRDGRRTPWAAARIAVDLVRTGILDPAAALNRLQPYDLDAIVRRTARASAGDVLGRGIAAGAGVATGAVAFDVERAQQLAAEGPVVLVRPDMVTADLSGIASAAGVLTAAGARTSHAAVIARQLGKVCVVGCSDLHVDPAASAGTLGGRVLHERDVITIDGGSGIVYAGRADVVVDRPDETLAVIRSWRATRAGAQTGDGRRTG